MPEFVSLQDLYFFQHETFPLRVFEHIHSRVRSSKPPFGTQDFPKAMLTAGDPELVQFWLRELVKTL